MTRDENDRLLIDLITLWAAILLIFLIVGCLIYNAQYTSHRISTIEQRLK